MADTAGGVKDLELQVEGVQGSSPQKEAVVQHDAVVQDEAVHAAVPATPSAGQDPDVKADAIKVAVPKDAEAKKEAVDRWALKELKASGKPWSEKNTKERVFTVVVMTCKVLLVLLMLYMFIISLGLMGNAFKVLGGKTSGRAFRQSELFNNPVASLALGILATVLVQSSSTSTSVIITMAAADLISMKNSIPMIMGANIGTAVTASIVSVAHVGDKDQYRRAFGGAVVHYCFNVLTVSILLPLEVICGLLQHCSYAMVQAFGITNDNEKGTKQDFLKIITKPVGSRLLQVDKKLVTKIAKELDPEKLADLEKKSIIQQSTSKDNHLFMDTPMTDDVAGVLLVIVSLIFLSVCLMLLVKTLQSIFRGRLAIWMGKFLNLEFKTVPFLGDYVLMVFGVGLTILMQSSSVTTSALTPLVGIGLIRVEKMFPFTIGANIGTTVTGVLAALASSNMEVGFQVAMSHLLFNVFGTIMFFMIPVTRAVPLAMAKFLGSLAADVKLFPICLIIFAWVLMPALLLGLGIAGVAPCAVVGGLILTACLLLIVLIWLRAYFPGKLPSFLSQNPAWLPPTLRSSTPDGQSSYQESITGSTEASDADMGSRGSWWQAPLVWGSGWFILMMLVVAVPNCQWGNFKYAAFEKRDHVGIGAFQACSKIFESKQDWAQAKDCSLADLQACASEQMSGCNDADYSSKLGANVAYEASWVSCRGDCSLRQWEAYCLDMKCGGELHTVQCTNVTKAVSTLSEKNVKLAYQNEARPAWLAGDRCRDISQICDNGDQLEQAGGFGWSGFTFVGIAQILLIAYLTNLFKPSRKFKILVGSLVGFALGWMCLLISWAMFASTVGSEATCTVMDVSNEGVVKATGNFGDIINGSGSYSYYFVIGSWCLTTLVVGLIGEHVYKSYKGLKGAGDDDSSNE